MVERLDPKWALYVLQRDFYGWPEDVEIRTRSSRHVDRSKS
jgi:hypothetical protein